MNNDVLGKNYKFNFIVNMMDGGFFGGALGFASFTVILPLFVSNLTSSAILIGLIPAIHMVGWQLPQIFTVRSVSRMRRYKPMVMWMTTQERLPFLGMALVSWSLPALGVNWALALTFACLVWQGMGGGLTATAWQAMIGKIIPPGRRGAFFGFQSAMANLFSSATAILAGLLLEKIDFPNNFMASFLIAGLFMLISFIFLGSTREQDAPPAQEVELAHGEFWGGLWQILNRDANFRWFLLVRMLSQLGVMAFAFYTVFAVRQHQMTDLEAGFMAAVLGASQTIANPLMGWMGDKYGHAAVMKMGGLAAAMSALLAWVAPDLGWFYLVFFLAGIANVSIWTLGLAMILDFGTEADRPAYIGLANTLVAPATILAPILGGWLADNTGYPVTFIVSAASALLATVVLHFMLKNPKENAQILSV